MMRFKVVLMPLLALPSSLAFAQHGKSNTVAFNGFSFDPARAVRCAG